MTRRRVQFTLNEDFFRALELRSFALEATGQRADEHVWSDMGDGVYVSSMDGKLVSLDIERQTLVIDGAPIVGEERYVRLLIERVRDLISKAS